MKLKMWDLRKFIFPTKQPEGWFHSSTDEALMVKTGKVQKPTSHLAPLKWVLLF